MTDFIDQNRINCLSSFDARFTWKIISLLVLVLILVILDAFSFRSGGFDAVQTSTAILVLTHPQIAAATPGHGRTGDCVATAVGARNTIGDGHVRHEDQLQFHHCSLRTKVSRIPTQITSNLSVCVKLIASRSTQSHRTARLHARRIDRTQFV